MKYISTIAQKRSPARTKKMVASHLLKSKKGQGLIEYLIIVALVAIGTMGVMRVMSQNVQAKFGKITQALHGGNNSVNVEPEALQEQHVKKKDMNDFFYGTRKQDENQQ